MKPKSGISRKSRMVHTQEIDSSYQDMSSKAEVSLIGKTKSTRMKDYASERQQNGSQQKYPSLGIKAGMRGWIVPRM